MRHRAIVFLAVLAMTALAAQSNAQQMRIGVYGDPVFECDFGLTAPFTVGTAHVIVTSSVDFRAVRFRAVVPPCNAITYLGDVVSGPYVAVGNSQTGIVISNTSCVSVISGVEILGITYFLGGAGVDPCEWVVTPYPGDAEIVMVDCDFIEGFAGSNGAGQINGGDGTCALVGENNVICGYRPTPADGSGGAPINQLLDWVGPANHVYLADHSFDTVIPGHDHDIDDLVFAPVFPGGPFAPTKPFDPGPLAPNTTYYWKLLNAQLTHPHVPSAISQVWSFTTEAPVAAEESTWGRIKSLYQ